MKKRVFIKFGKAEHLQSIVEGNLRFTPAKAYIDIEKKEGNDTQGDRLEGKTVTHSNHVTFTSHETGQSKSFSGNILMEMNYEGVEELPVFCISFVDADLQDDEDGHKTIIIPEDYVAKMRDDFSESTHALIIMEPDVFISSVTAIREHNIIGDAIHYFDYSLNTIEHFMFLFTGEESITDFPKEELPLQYSDRHRLLLCKDIKYASQNEYRFIALDEALTKPEFYSFNMNAKASVVPVEDLSKPLQFV